jgi:hypothetical protein
MPRHAFGSTKLYSMNSNSNTLVPVVQACLLTIVLSHASLAAFQWESFPYLLQSSPFTTTWGF